MTKKINISFVDLSHTGKTVDTNYFPLGIAYIASYAQKVFGDAISVELNKYPSDLSNYLEKTTPEVACFSNFSWNFNLGYEFAKQIKKNSPNIITVFGGPNYSNLANEQEAFLKAHPDIDFYILEEGELPFTALLKIFISNDFNMDRIIEEAQTLPGIHFFKNNKFARNVAQPRIQDLSILPSPILGGLMDKFVYGDYIPMVQTTRGCPYSCTYCHDGTVYQNKLKRFPREIYLQEIEYIARRTKVPHLCIPDLNFGIFEEDYQTAEYIAGVQKKYDWPKSLDITAAKNNKERISRIVDLLGNTYLMGASVQSTDQTVLKNIKRTNLTLDELVKMAQKSAQYGGNSYSEVILCLPGDTKQAHFKSVFALIEGGMDEVRMYQFILLAGTEGGSNISRQKYGYQTKWRVLPRCFGKYDFFGKKIPVAEIHEVCVANNTMTHQDYRDCRKLNLIVEIFNNGKVFGELFRFLDLVGIARADILHKVYLHGMSGNDLLGSMLKEFEKNEERNFFETREELEEFIRTPGNIERYLSGEYGINQIMGFRSAALIQHLEYNTKLVFDIARNELKNSDRLNEINDLYLKELSEYILACRASLLSNDKVFIKEFHFDFMALFETNFTVNPLEFRVENGIDIKIDHSDSQKKEIDGIFKQFGRSIDGLGHLMQRANIFKLYRRPGYVNAHVHAGKR